MIRTIVQSIEHEDDAAQFDEKVRTALAELRRNPATAIYPLQFFTAGVSDGFLALTCIIPYDDFAPQAGGADMSDKVLADVASERARQTVKWGVQRHPWPYWLGILGEEYGEVCNAVIELPAGTSTLAAVREELIHLGAVAAAMVEHIDEVQS